MVQFQNKKKKISNAYFIKFSAKREKTPNKEQKANKEFQHFFKFPILINR